MRNMAKAFGVMPKPYAHNSQMKTSTEKQTSAAAMIRKNTVHAAWFVNKYDSNVPA